MKKDENAAVLAQRIGLILLTPPLLGVIIIIINFIYNAILIVLTFIGYEGFYYNDLRIIDDFGKGLEVPIYLGLMAIAGAYLIKE